MLSGWGLPTTLHATFHQGTSGRYESQRREQISPSQCQCLPAKPTAVWDRRPGSTANGLLQPVQLTSFSGRCICSPGSIRIVYLLERPGLVVVWTDLLTSE